MQYAYNFSILLFVCLAACGSDVVFDEEGSRQESSTDMGLEDVARAPDGAMSEAERMPETLEEVIARIPDYSATELPIAPDGTGLIECHESSTRLCPTLQLFDYVMFGKIVELAPMPLSESQQAQRLEECEGLHYRQLLVTLEVFEELKQEKSLDDPLVDVYMPLTQVRAWTPGLAFDRDEALVWLQVGGLKKGDVIGLLGSREESTQIIIAGPLMSLEQDLEQLVVSVQDGVTCWGDHPLRGMTLSALRAQIDKCKAVGQFENTRDANPSRSSYVCLD